MATPRPLPQHSASVSLSDAEQDEINNRVLSGDAEESCFAGEVGVVRLGTYVLLELDGRQHVEMHPDEQAAHDRYEELRREYAAPRAS
jgi:hypothetical protein